MRVSRDHPEHRARGDGEDQARWGCELGARNLHQGRARDGSHLQRGGRAEPKFNVAPSASRTHNGRTYASKAEMLYAQQLEVDPTFWGLPSSHACNWGRTRRTGRTL